MGAEAGRGQRRWGENVGVGKGKNGENGDMGRAGQMGTAGGMGKQGIR